MSKIAMVTWDGGGNVPPTQHIACELQSRGHEVRVLGHPAQQGRFASARLEFVPYRRALPWSRVEPLEDPMAIFHTFVDGGAGNDLEDLLAQWPADLIVADCLMLGPLQAAEASGIRTVALVHSFWAFFGEMLPHSPLTDLAAPFGRQPTELLRRAGEVWVASDRTLDPVQGPVPSNVFWTGVAQPPAQPVLERNRQRALLSLSTVWFPGQQESMQRILDAVAELPLEVVATIDRNIAAKNLRVPQNVQARAFVDHGEVMPTVGMVIGHGGHATTMYALAHGLPVLVIPQFQIDQPVVGQQLASCGAGAVLPQDAGAPEIQQAVMTLLQSDEPANAARSVGERIRGQNGTLVAAERAEALLSEQVAV
jgi:UDP:flavonoid glycosyltransferase YjiC (YdhE family)